MSDTLGSAYCGICGNEINTKIAEIVKDYQVPDNFICPLCGQIKFNLKPLRNLVFLWPKPVPDMIGRIYIPDRVKVQMQDEYGLVLAAGKGYYTKAGNWKPSNLKTGDVVIYDKNVPWKQMVSGIDVKYMSTVDVKGIVKA